MQIQLLEPEGIPKIIVVDFDCVFEGSCIFVVTLRLYT